jgi:hypothetical protein
MLMHTLSKNCTRKESKKAINISGQSTNVMVTALSKHYTILYCISASRNSQKCKFFAPIYFHSLYIYIMVVRSPLGQVDVPQPQPFFWTILGRHGQYLMEKNVSPSSKSRHGRRLACLCRKSVAKKSDHIRG